MCLARVADWISSLQRPGADMPDTLQDIAMVVVLRRRDVQTCILASFYLFSSFENCGAACF